MQADGLARVVAEYAVQQDVGQRMKLTPNKECALLLGLPLAKQTTSSEQSTQRGKSLKRDTRELRDEWAGTESRSFTSVFLTIDFSYLLSAFPIYELLGFHSPRPSGTMSSKFHTGHSRSIARPS